MINLHVITEYIKQGSQEEMLDDFVVICDNEAVMAEELSRHKGDKQGMNVFETAPHPV